MAEWLECWTSNPESQISSPALAIAGFVHCISTFKSSTMLVKMPPDLPPASWDS